MSLSVEGISTFKGLWNTIKRQYDPMKDSREEQREFSSSIHSPFFEFIFSQLYFVPYSKNKSPSVFRCM
uniref:Uncharacterized protein n=1 Tax=Lepeophtheirus salmonis TaxID=72036 RepID=A0A0K2TJH7_LEPSM